jgi:hypothetical protein
MRCLHCERTMRPLFTSCVCDHCDGIAEVGAFRGYIVYRGEEDLGGRPVYVFRTATDAAIWRNAQGLQHSPIRAVLSESPFRWRVSSGSIRDVELAERPFEIYPDHRFPPDPHRAYLAPKSASRAA